MLIMHVFAWLRYIQVVAAAVLQVVTLLLLHRV